MGTTRPLSPGWRADSRTTSVPLGWSRRGRRPSPRPGSPWPPTGRTAPARPGSRPGRPRWRRRGPTARRGCARSRLGLGDLRLAPGVAQLDGDERLDEQGLAAARRVVDDALDPRPGLGLDRHHVAAVAQGDDGLLERAAELRADERVQPAAEPVVGDAHGRAQPAEPRRGRVEQLADRIEAARRACCAAPGSGWSSRPRSRSSGRRSSASDVARRAVASSVSAMARNCSGVEPAAARRPRRRTGRCRGRRRCRRRAAPRAAPGPGRSRRASGPR